jgi:hypothetical protein
VDSGSDFHLGAADPAQDPVLRSRQRLDRQARVGILRNQNRPSLPPPHRPQLMGRWMQLRSSRRPPPQDNAATAPQPDRDHAAPVQLVESGSEGITRIDIARLMTSVEGMGHPSRQRDSFAADVMQGPAQGNPHHRMPADAPALTPADARPDTPLHGAAGPAPVQALSLRAALTDPQLVPGPPDAPGLRAALRRVLDRLPGLGIRQG